MREDLDFQQWLSNITQEEGVNSIQQARVLLNHIEKRQKDVHFFGICLSSFIVCAIKTIYQGGIHIANMNNPEFKIDFDVFSYAIPFVSFVLDHSIKRVTNIQNHERSIWVFLKLSMIVYYLGVYVMSLEIQGAQNLNSLNNFFIMTTVNLIFFPILSGIYSSLLYKGKLN